VQVAGIIAGQITLGILADRIGRKWGSVTTASLMLIGGILILASAGNSPHGIFLMYTTCQVCMSMQFPYTASQPPNNCHLACLCALTLHTCNQSNLPCDDEHATKLRHCCVYQACFSSGMSIEKNDHSAWSLLSAQHLAVIRVAVSGFRSLQSSVSLSCSVSVM